MDEHQCTNCGASLPPTGTYCLACDTPVEGAVRGLSVAEPTTSQVGRPLLGVSIIGAIVVVLALIAFGAHGMLQHKQNDEVHAAALKGVRMIASAEGGDSGVCKYTQGHFAGTPQTEKLACRALVGHDPNVKLKRLHVTHSDRHGSGATVNVRGTVVDARGHRIFERDVKLVKYQGTWVFDWDGTPVV
ncbi:MAG: hypothetical protein JWP74_2956 [Marmoricola sp.]|nr:hypothetical protein [Marmoricola sp.]